MRAEKKYVSQEYLEKLESSPYFIVVDYHRLVVDQFAELRTRLSKVEAEIHVVKNTIFAIAAKEAGVAELKGQLGGQLAVVTGTADLASAAKVIKTFRSEFDKPKMVFGYMGSDRMEAADLETLADLPSLDVMRGRLAGVIAAPMTQLVRVINTPGQQLAQVIKAYSEKE